MKTSISILGNLLLTLVLSNCFAQQAIITKITDDDTDYTGPMIDMHSHAFNENSSFSLMLGKEMDLAMTGKIYKASASMEKLREETLAKFEEYNIVKAMVSQGELWYEFAPEKVIIGNNHFLSIEELRLKHKEGKLDVLGEVAPNYQGILPTDDSLKDYYDLAEELGVPIAYHLFPGGPPGGAYIMYPEIRAFQGKPLQLEEILFSHPRMKIYIMHAGWPYLEDMKALMYAHPQVYVDLGVIDWVLPVKEFHHFLKGLVDAGFGKRIMFGTDSMIWVDTIDDAIAAINSADFLSMEQKEDIFYNNAARFLNLTDEEIKKHKGQ
ncbi:MAG: amidohydrolase family protein [Eudoraea sp.]|nr:amidohydrolase family protein [Eudoraea sp.]